MRAFCEVENWKTDPNLPYSNPLQFVVAYVDDNYLSPWPYWNELGWVVEVLFPTLPDPQNFEIYQPP